MGDNPQIFQKFAFLDKNYNYLLACAACFVLDTG